MNTLTLQNPAASFHNPIVIRQIQNAVHDALESVEESRQKCLIAGQMLNEVQTSLEHGQFQKWIEKHLPSISYRTAHRWAQAGANIVRAIGPIRHIGPISESDAIPVSQILTTPDAELTEPQREYKQAWLDLTEDRTIKECTAGVFVDGDEAHRLDRAINGKTKGGVGKQKDRKAFEKFTAIKLQHITSFLTVQKKSAGAGQKRVIGWRKLSPVQQTQIGAAFTVFWQTAPSWLLEICADKIRTESKLAEAARIAR